MPKINHSKLGVTAELTDFSQAQYETYHHLLLPLNGVSAAESNGGVVRAAIKAEFLKGIEIEKVAEMKPSAVIWLTRKISEHVTAIVTVPDDDPN